MGGKSSIRLSLDHADHRLNFFSRLITFQDIRIRYCRWIIIKVIYSGSVCRPDTTFCRFMYTYALYAKVRSILQPN